MIDYNLLLIQNPWWKSSSAIGRDPKIKEYEDSAVKYNPDNILNLQLNQEAVNIVFGPRQTGKSTALKLRIRQLLKEDFPAEQIFYFNCDAVSSRQELIDLILRYQESIKKDGEIPENYLFLDEISSVNEWPFAIKWLTDAGLLASSRILLTGSSSINLKKSGEYLPGRRKGGKDINFLPITFADFFSLVYPELEIQPIQPDISLLQRLQESLLKQEIASIRAYRNFLLTGGFLKMIDLFVKQEPYVEAVELYNSMLKSEMAKFGRKEINSRMILRKLISSLTAETSYTNIAEEAELGSKNTAIDYLNFFSDSFLLNQLFFYSIPQKRLKIKKNKKFYPIDPFLLWAFKGFVTGATQIETMHQEYLKAPLSSQLAELFVASELYKKGFEVYYYKNQRELDFYIPEFELGIEVKYKNKITSDDLKPLEKVKRKILVSKNTLSLQDKVLIVPVDLFSFLQLDRL